MPHQISPGSTKEKILLTALDLYAAQGIDAVSLRMISAESGTRNSAAAHYHFGDKTGLIDAMVAWLARHLDLISHEETAFLRQACEAPKLVADILLAGLFRSFRLRGAYPWGGAATKFMSRLLLETDPAIRAAINRSFLPHLILVRAALQTALPAANEPRLTLRILFIAESIAHVAAELETLPSAPMGDFSTMTVEDATHEYLAFLEGGLVHGL